MAISFCPHCGKPISLAGTPFCAYCGKPLAAAGQPAPVEAPGASPAPAPQFVAAPQYSPGPQYAQVPQYAAAQYAAAPQYAQPSAVVIATSPKSPGMAVLFEFLLAGGGMMYADRVWIGVAWLVGTILLPIIGGVVISAFAAQASSYSYMYGYAAGQSSGYAAGVVVTAVVVAALALIGVIVRCVLATRYVGEYNARLAARVSGGAGAAAIPGMSIPGQPAPVTTTRRAIAVSVGVAVLFLALDAASTQFLIASFAVAVLLPAAYWFGLVRARHMPLGRVLGESFLVSVIGSIPAIVAMAQAEAARIQASCTSNPQYCDASVPNPSAGDILAEPSMWLWGVLIPAMVVSLISIIAVLVFARWNRVRSTTTPTLSGIWTREYALPGGVLAVGCILSIWNAIALESGNWWDYRDQATSFMLVAGILGIAAIVIATRQTLAALRDARV